MGAPLQPDKMGVIVYDMVCVAVELFVTVTFKIEVGALTVPLVLAVTPAGNGVTTCQL
jgi:hypothetical protein